MTLIFQHQLEKSGGEEERRVSFGRRRGTIEDVQIPPHLFLATGNAGSLRDNNRDSMQWEPQPALPTLEDYSFEKVIRRSTLRSGSVDEPPSFPRRYGSRQSQNADGIALKSDQEILGHNAAPRKLSYLEPKDIDPTHHQSEYGPKAASDRSISWANHDPFSSRERSTVKTNLQTNLLTPSPSTGERRGTIQSFISHVAPDIIHRRGTNASFFRRSSLWQTYETAKRRGVELQREKYVQILFEYAIYAILVLFVYFVFVGVPFWRGAVYWMWWLVATKLVLVGGCSITLGIAVFYAYAPLLILFEKDPPPAEYTSDSKVQANVQDTALLIPCYKSAALIAATLEAALKIFPPSHVFVIANGNSPAPLDNTEEVCRPYGVNHVWSPIGSKIIAQFVGCYAAKTFKYVLLIDDDCALPDNFPVVTERLVGNVQCIGYTIKSVGPNSSKGNLCQQAQDLEYKLSGIQRAFAGKIGSATFPHGAISLWDRQVLVKTFYEHPGFSVSEDWFFGHVARQLGCRIEMCSQVFVETETPKAVFSSSGGARGGFGEMTIFQQRFKRWNFFFVNGIWYNMAYIFGNWKLGWWELGAKIFVFQEVYEVLLYLFTPFLLPIAFYVRPDFCGILVVATIVMYLVNVIIFNEIHLRLKNERLGWRLLYIYYLPYKMILTGINVASCYWSLWKYARYFAKRHPKVTEDEKAVAVVLHLEEESDSQAYTGGRRMTAKTITWKSQSDVDFEDAAATVPVTDADIAIVITEPEAVHARLNSMTMQEEGIQAFDFAATRRETHFGAQRAHYVPSQRSRYSGVGSSSDSEDYDDTPTLRETHFSAQRADKWSVLD